jgi:hypothetical protein
MKDDSQAFRKSSAEFDLVDMTDLRSVWLGRVGAGRSALRKAIFVSHPRQNLAGGILWDPTSLESLRSDHSALEKASGCVTHFGFNEPAGKFQREEERPA